MLDTIIRLSNIIRQSPEGIAWRTAWESVRNTYPNMPNLTSSQSLKLSPEAILSIFCTSESVEARPVMLPFLIVKHPVIQNYPNFINELRQNSELSRQYNQLVKQFVFFSLIVGHLRSISPGYPHEYLIFNAPNTPWTKLSNFKEVPLTMEKTLIERTKGNLLRAIGLEMKSNSNVLLKELMALTSKIQEDATFIRLNHAVKNIEKNKNLAHELGNSKQVFEKQIQEITQVSEPPHIRNQKISDLAFHIYKTKGGRILEYVNAFNEYEALIEKIYWLFTQFVVRENISCLSTSDENQLQQVMLGNSPYPLLTAISRSNSRSRSIGQLVHLSISNTKQNLNGLYLVDQTQEMYKSGFGMRYYFKARMLWQTNLQTLEDSVEKSDMQGFLRKYESISSPDSYRLEISSKREKPLELEFGNPIINFSLSKTMYLPY